MRAIFSNHCGPIFSGSMMNPHLNMHCNPASIFGGTGNFGCGCNNGIFSNFSFGFGVGIGIGLGNFFNNMMWSNNPCSFFNMMPFNFNNGFLPNNAFNCFDSFVPSTNFNPYSGMISGGHTQNTQVSSGVTRRGNNSTTRDEDNYNISSSDDNSFSRSSTFKRNKTENSALNEEEISSGSGRVTVENGNKTRNENSSRVDNTDLVLGSDVEEVQNKNQEKLKEQNQKFESLSSEIKEEMQRITKDALKKFIKNGCLAANELLIQRVPVTITALDFSGIFDNKKGTKNDYRNNNGDIVRVADGTIASLKFRYKGEEYIVQIESNKVPKKGEQQKIIQEENITITYGGMKQVISK